MKRAALRAPTTSPLLDELRQFLALEMPLLLEDVPRTEEGLEERILAALDRKLRAPRGLPMLWPGVDAARAVEWTHESLRELLRGFFRRREIRLSLTDAERRLVLRTMIRTRALDNALKRLFVEKTIAWNDYPSPQKGFRSLGQEAVVAIALPLRRRPDGDIVSPLIRDLGVALMFDDDPEKVLRVQIGKKGIPMDGRDLHIGDFAKGVLPPTAPLAIATQTLIGIAYAFRLDGSDRVCVSFIGEGGSSLGEWHEAINFAAVQRLNMLFIVENNHWALGTHVSEQSAVRRFALKAAGYGIPGITVLGNDPDEIAAAAAWATHRARLGNGPTLIELVTYRRCGHAHHDDERYHGIPEQKIPGYELPQERAAWGALDPIELYARRLGLERTAEEWYREAEEEMAQAVARATAAPWPEPEDFLDRVYAPRVEPVAPAPASPKTAVLTYDAAIRRAMEDLMEADMGVFVLGEDVGGRYGGAFAVTRGLAKRFGAARCLNTPLAESAIVGCGVGAALMGKKPIVEIQFADFLAPAFNALVNNAAKIYWRWGGRVGLVVRLPYGGHTGDLKLLLGGGPFHSQCPEAWFLRTPGWKIVAPSTPSDAHGLLVAAVRDGNPVIYLEAKGLYGFFRPDLKEAVPVGVWHEVPIGRAAVRREGRDVTVLTYGPMVYACVAAAGQLAAEGIQAEVIDLRSLEPLDQEAIATSVAKTHRVVIAHEDTRRGGVGAELAARIVEGHFWELDVPVVRVAAPDTPIPYSPPLEYAFLPKAQDVVVAVRRLMEMSS